MYLFRIDIGSNHGLGHYQRIKSLIKILKIKKYRILVDYFEDVLSLNEDRKKFVTLYDKKSSFKNETKDAAILAKFIKKNNYKPIIIKDSYRFGFKWEKYLSNYSKHMIVIDDECKTKHFADYYINYNPQLIAEDNSLFSKIRKSNKRNCNFLLGPKYSLFNFNINKKEKKNSDIIFYNGGSGNILVYEKIIKYLIKFNNKDLKIVLIVGPFAKNFKDVKKKFSKYKFLTILNKPNNIPDYLNRTKLFVSSAGVSMFESSHLKVPTLLFKMNKNQNLSDYDYQKIGHYFILDKKDLFNTKKIAKLILLMLKNRKELKKILSNSKLNLRNIKASYNKNLKINS